MILNVNEQEVIALLDALHNQELPVYNHLKEKLRRLRTTSETVKSTIKQVRAVE